MQRVMTLVAMTLVLAACDEEGSLSRVIGFVVILVGVGVMDKHILYEGLETLSLHVF